ncbi:uncharacterized protein [Periplaneta americana]|uniref:uncharacterized protein n=1 Tax=Periplaneta americana TaxID=6978 RepID=UPI0037E752EB
MAARIIFILATVLCSVQLLAATDVECRQGPDDDEDIGENNVEVFNSLFAQLAALNSTTGNFNLKTQKFILNISSIFQNLKDRIQSIIANITQTGSQLANCMTSEKENVTELIHEGEQEALACGQSIIVEVRPVLDQAGNVTSEAFGLILQVTPLVLDCISKHATQPIRLIACLISKTFPLSTQIFQVISDVTQEVKLIQKAIGALEPKLKVCEKQLVSAVSRIGKIVVEIEQCVENTLKGSSAN